VTATVAPDESAARPGRALAWSFLNTAVGRFGTVAIGIVLARLLGPVEFGTYAVALVALMAILSFNELGVSLAIVRWPGDPSAIAPTVTAISVMMSAVLTVVAVAAAPWFASAMGAPEATNAVRLLSLCVLINGLVATPAALMQRLFRQRQRMVVDQVNVWLGAVVSVLLAASGMGAMSLVVGRLAGAGVSGVLFLRYSPLPYRFGLDRRHAGHLLSFGLPLAGASVVAFLVGFVDQLIVGHALGATLLGFYVLATNMAGWPHALFSQPLRSVAPALFARLQHDRALLRGSFPLVLRPLVAVALPICAALAATAPDLVRFVYGDGWGPAGTVLRWLAVLAALRILFELAYDYLVVLGRSRAVLWLQVWWIATLVPVLWLAVRWQGLSGAAPAAAGVAIAISLPLYLQVLHTEGLALGVLARAVAPALAGAAAVVGAGLLASGVLSPLPALAVTGLLAAGVAAALLWRRSGDLAVFRGGERS
jgi:O-antigen/teichoic acid export membrane protein